MHRMNYNNKGTYQSVQYLQSTENTIPSGGSNKTDIKKGTERPPLPFRLNWIVLSSCLTTQDKIKS